MEELVIFRLFMAFPVIGLFIPDVGMLLSGFGIKHIPVAHLIIEVTLAVCILICSAWIMHNKRKEARKHTGDKSLISA